MQIFFYLDPQMNRQLEHIRRRGALEEEGTYIKYATVAGIQFAMGEDFAESVKRGIRLVLEKSKFVGTVRIELNFGLYISVMRENGYEGRTFTPGSHTNTIIHPFIAKIKNINQHIDETVEKHDPTELAVRLVLDKIGSGYKFVGFYTGVCSISQQ